jgi:hypothetical protein
MLRPTRRPMCFFCAGTRGYAVRAIVLGELKYTACTSLLPREGSTSDSSSTYRPNTLAANTRWIHVGG